MFIATANINSFAVFYMGGNPAFPKPGKYRLEIRKDCIRIYMPLQAKFSISYSDMESASITYDVKDTLSAGKTIVGGVLAGPVGALAGAAMGSKKVQPYLVVKCRNDGGQFVFSTKQAELLQKKIQKRIA